MKNFNTYLLLVLVFSFFGCEIVDELVVEENQFSIVPPTFLGRDNYVLGTVYVEDRNIILSIWDHGQIDGDIVSIYANGNLIIDNWELDGPSNKYEVDVKLEYKGYNYILLYAHNEGEIRPNTVSTSVDDGISSDEFILESDLESNGTIDLVVQ